MKDIYDKLYLQQTLSIEEAYKLMNKLALGELNESQIASLLTVYLMRSISIEEFMGFAQGLLAHRVDLAPLQVYNPIDIVGTGGDGKNTFNISTLACFVVAAAGYKVAKHGNYGVSSISGSSTVMEELGVSFSSDLDKLERSLVETNITFLHAPLFNSGMMAASAVRKELGVRTLFNMLGPVINPIQSKRIVLGVYNLKMARMYQYMYQKRDTDFIIVHSLDGYDEISLTNEFKVIDKQGELIQSPEALGFKRCKERDLYGGQKAKEAAQIFLDVLNNRATDAQLSSVVANAAYAIQLIEPSQPLENSIAQAKEAIESGAAERVFNQFKELNS